MANEIESDFAILLVGAARVVADRLGEATEDAGVSGMRAPFGFVIRVLAEEGRTLTELARLLDVSKQAAIKVVDEMEVRGFVVRKPDPLDRRQKILHLSEKGWTVRRAALRASRQMERELRAKIGDADVGALRRTLLAFLDEHGVLEDATAGRARALW
jgi:DNA-binding MarR family transcriptional regulator